MSAGRALGSLRALRILSMLETTPTHQLFTSLAEATNSMSSMQISQQHQLINLKTSYYNSPPSTRSFASSPIHRQAEPQAVEHSTTNDELISPDTIPVFQRLEDRIEAPYTIPPQPVFAVVEVGGTQFKVTPDDLIYTEKLSDIAINDKLKLSRVLLLGSTAETIIGRPYIPGASVTVAVEEQVLDGKVTIFKKRRRKNSRRLKGHRQPLTGLRILSVEGIEPAAEAAAAEQ